MKNNRQFALGFLPATSPGRRAETAPREDGTLRPRWFGLARPPRGTQYLEELVTEKDLTTWRKRDPAKQSLAARLRRETTLRLKAIAARVNWGASKIANAWWQPCLSGNTNAKRGKCE